MLRTTDEIKKMMMDVVKAIEDADVPEDLRVTAFEKGFDALMDTAVPAGLPAASAGQTRGREEVVEASNGPSLAAIAARLGLDRDLVGEIFYVDGDTLGL